MTVVAMLALRFDSELKTLVMSRQDSIGRLREGV